MYEITDEEDLALLSLSKTQYAAFTKMQSDLAALTKRADAQDDFMKRAHAVLDEVQALNKRRAEDEAIVKEFRETGRTPAALLMRQAKERAL